MILASHGIIASSISGVDADWLAYYNRVIAAGGSLTTTDVELMVLMFVPLTSVACFASNAVCVALETGLFASLVLSTLFNDNAVFNADGVIFFVSTADVSTIGNKSAAVSTVTIVVNWDIF